VRKLVTGCDVILEQHVHVRAPSLQPHTALLLFERKQRRTNREREKGLFGLYCLPPRPGHCHLLIFGLMEKRIK
jgi:hypothetical protein